MPRQSATHCKNCGMDLDLNPVYMGVNRINRCKDCYNEYHRNYRSENKERVGTYKTRESIKNSALKTLYGITLDEYKHQVELHLGGCAICKQPSESLSVDHNHKTGGFRGLLCKKCNAGLGAFNDDEDLLLNAIEYLKRTTWKKAG